MKGRRNQRTYKIRTTIKPNNINLLLDGKKFGILKKIYSNNEVINSFIYESLRKKIEPKVIVDYFRRNILYVYKKPYCIFFINCYWNVIRYLVVPDI